MKAAMATVSSLTSSVSAILLYALLFASTEHIKVTANNVPYILPVCKAVGGGSQFFDVQFCLEALGSDVRSGDSGMDYRNFSIVAVDLLTANATNTARKINNLLGEGGSKDDATTPCLQSCLALYSDIVQRQASCAAAITDKRDNDAKSSLERCASAAKECEDGFGKSKVASPVTMEDDDAFKLAKLAVALLSNDY